MCGGGEEDKETLRRGEVLDQNQGVCGPEQELGRRVQLRKTLYGHCPTLALTLKIPEMDLLIGRGRH